MLRSHWKWSAVMALGVWALLAVQPARAQVGVVTVRSVDALMGDVKYLLKVAGREDLAKTLESLLSSLSPDGKPFGGIDTKRPLGLYLNMPKEAGGMPTGAFFIPVSKDSEFLDFLTRVNVQHEKGEKGLYTIKTPQDQTLYAKFAHNYVFAADNSAHLEGPLVDPGTVIPATHKNALAAASFRVDQVPQQYKEMLLNQVNEKLKEAEEKKAGENDLEHQGRVFGAKVARDVVKMLVEESKEVTLSLQVDQQKNQIGLDLALVPKQGSKLAGGFRTFGAGRSMFGGFVKDSALNFLAHLPVSGDLHATALKLLDQALQEGLKSAKTDKEKQLAEKLYKAVLPTLQSDTIDMGSVLYGPLDDGKYVAVAGLKVKDGKNLEKTVQDIVNEIPEKDRKGVKLNHAKVGDAAVHLIVPPEEPDEDLKRSLGNNHVLVAFRNDVVLVAVGEHGLKGLQDSLSALRSGPDQGTSPVQFELSISKLAPLAKEDQEKVVEAAKKVFVGEAKGKDRVRVSLQGGDTLRLRVGLNAEIIKLVAELAPIP